MGAGGTGGGGKALLLRTASPSPWL
eukprot:COSAG01_NODE_21023_length_922_cov_0.899149_1_plen_24_part_10